MFPLKEIRAQFPILKRKINGSSLVYLDTAATAQKPQCVIDAMSQFYAHEYASVHRSVYTLAQDANARYEGVREQIRVFFAAPEDYQVIFTRGTTDSINLVAQSFTQAFLSPGDEIVVVATEHHSNLVPWQMTAKRLSLKLRTLEVDSNGEITGSEQIFSDKTRLVAIAHVSNVTGAVHPVEKICKEARIKGVYTLIDGAQSAAHLPVNLEKIEPDFFVASAHKMYGPTGLGFLIGRSELLEQMPPIQGGGDMIDQVGFDAFSYAKPPLRFEAGTPMIAQVIGLGAALEFVQNIGLQSIYEREKELLDSLIGKLSSIEGLRITANPQNRANLVTFELEGLHSLDVATLLDARGICVRSGHLCAQPALKKVHKTLSVLRASLGIYTSEEDVSALVDALEGIHLGMKAFIG